MTATDHLPIIDIAPLAGADPERRLAVARDIRRACEDTGFLYVVGHGVPAGLTDAAFAASRAFHALPLERKMAVRMNAFHRGYMPMASSTIVTSSVARVTRPNLSESFMMMHELAPDDPALLAGLPLQGPNPWPAELPAFRTTLLAYNDALQAVARRLVRAIALGLALPEDWFDRFFEQPTTWLRLLHYPPSPPDAPGDQYGSAPHTDYGFLTVLAQDRAGGLEVRRRDGTWLAATPIAGSFVVNVADMLMRWSNGILPSTPHRVRNLSGGDRYSIPFFFDPAMDTVIEPLPGCVPAGEAARFAPVRFGDYVMQRLDRNYAYRQSGETAPAGAEGMAEARE